MPLHFFRSFRLFFLAFLFLTYSIRSSEENGESRKRSNLVDYSIRAIEKPAKGKIDVKMLMPKIPKHIQVYIAVAFSERDFPSYSKIFNKTLSSIPNSFLISDSLNRRYNISLSPLFFVLPNSGRFSSSIYEVMCSSFDKKRVVAILVIGESPAAFTVSLAAVTSNIPVLWARGGIPNPPGTLQQQDPLEIRLEPTEIQLFEAVRGLFIATHWHSFTVMASPSLAARCASILDVPPLSPKVVTITQNSHNVFRKLADVSRSTRGVVLLLGNLSEAILVMSVAKKLSILDGHFVWIWIDTTTKPALFLTTPTFPRRNHTEKYNRYLKKQSVLQGDKEERFFQKDSTKAESRVANQARQRTTTTSSKELREVLTKTASLKPISESRNRRYAIRKKKYADKETENNLNVVSHTQSSKTNWEKPSMMDHPSDSAIQLDYPGEIHEFEDLSAPVSRTWGKITEHFPIQSPGHESNQGDLGDNALPVGLLSVKPEPMIPDRHLLKGSIRLLMSSLHVVLKKNADWLGILDADSSCWTKPSAMNRNFSEMYAREIRQAVGDSLSGQTQERDRADQSLLANFQILNLVPEKFHVNLNGDESVIKDAVMYWRQVGKVLGRSAHLNTIVWPGGDLVAAALSARTRSVFRIVTALAPPFVMESALDEDGQCLRGIICHRVLNSDKDNLTLVFNEMETQERMEDEVEELGINERTEKPFQFLYHSYFEFQAAKYKYKSSCCYGLAMDLLENVAQELEFEFHLYIIPDGAYGSKSHVWEQGSPHSKWNGIVGDLVSGAAHMSFAALSVSKQRSQVIDFSTPFFFSSVSFLAAPNQKSEVPLLAFLLPFSTELWIAIFTSLNITAMAVACYEWLSPFGLNPWGRQRSRNFSIASALWVMWGLLCGHLVAFKAPKSWPNKFLINVWGGFSVIFVASYTANIAALIAGLFFHNSVSDYHDRSLLTQRVGAPKSSSADYYIHRANQHLWEHMQKYSFKDIETGISLLRNGSLDILVADTPILDYYRATDHGCKLQKIVEAINEDTYAIGMNKGFPLKESISAVISKYSNNGYMDILTEKWYGGLPCFKMTPSVELTDVGQPRPLGVAAVAGVFLLLVLGMIVGILILILEHLFYRYTLPVLRHQPKGTVWRSRNIMFFSQKLYRFINCVELVSPHHAARELVHTLRQGQITSLFQKSVKRKEHEQRRRRKSKAQFFEMIQEIRRVQQEEKGDSMKTKKASGDSNTQTSPRGQLRDFLTSPHSLKQFYNSKLSIGSQISNKVPDTLNPSEFSQQAITRKSPKSFSRLNIRRFSKELFSLPKSPKNSKIKSCNNLEGRSPDVENTWNSSDSQSGKTSEIRLSAKDIKIQASKTIGRRLSKDASSWLTISPPDLNWRKKSICQDAVHVSTSNVSCMATRGTIGSALNLNELRHNESSNEFSIGPLPTPVASSADFETATLAKARPRLPSPPSSPIPECQASKVVNLSNGLYDTVITKKDSISKKFPVNAHGRSRSLDNKHLICEASRVSIVNLFAADQNRRKQTISYATLKHPITTLDFGKACATQNFLTSRESDSFKVQESRAFPVKKNGNRSEKNSREMDFAKEPNKTSFPSNESDPIYAEPQKVTKRAPPKNEGNSAKQSDSAAVNEPKVPKKRKNCSKHTRQVRACSAPETSHPFLTKPAISDLRITSALERPDRECTYYSKNKKTRNWDSISDSNKDFQGMKASFGGRTNQMTMSSKGQFYHSDSEHGVHPAATKRSRSVPEHRFSDFCERWEEAENCRRKSFETPILVLQLSRSPPKNAFISKGCQKRNRSREETNILEVSTRRTCGSPGRKRFGVANKNTSPSRRQASERAEPP